MKFTYITAILALLNASARANPTSTAAADHHGEGDVDVDADVVVSLRHADSKAVLSNVQDDYRILKGGSKSVKQPKRIRERESSKSSKQANSKSSKADSELCIWDEKANFDLSVVKEYVGLVIESVNVAKLTLTDPEPEVVLVVPNGVLTNLPERVSMISQMATKFGEEESTFSFVETKNFEVAEVGDVVAVYLDCGREPKIVAYKGGVKKFNQGVVLGVSDSITDDSKKG